MKTNRIIALFLVVLATFSSQLPTLLAQGTTFTYQGRLAENGIAYTGNAEFQMTLWDAANAGNTVATNNPAALIASVTNGLFVLPLDFGANFPGAGRWLQLEVRTTIGSFTLLSPRQQLTPTPYAITASNLTGTLPASQLSGTLSSANFSGIYSGAVTFGNSSNKFTGNYSGDGSGVTNLNANNLTSGIVPDARLAANVARTNQLWLLSGNAGTTPGAHFIGTTDNQPFELKVNNARGLRVEPAGGAPNLIGGSSANSVAAGITGAAISGGSSNTIAASSSFTAIAGGWRNGIGTNATSSAIGGGIDNHVAANAQISVIAGGQANDIGTNSALSVIGGGLDNNIARDSQFSTIVGGIQNDIGTNSYYTFIGGGYNNIIAANSESSTVGGGRDNTAIGASETVGGGSGNTASGGAATVSGGFQNTASGGYATVGGGYRNSASGDYSIALGSISEAVGHYSFAAGRFAKANHLGSFVWADSQVAEFASTANDQFSIRASGGVRFSDDTPALSFGSQARQMINLYNTSYGIGVQSSTTYFRSNSRFSWFRGGVHDDAQNDPGTGGTVLMTLTSGGLTVNGVFVSASDRNVKAGFTPVDAKEILEKVAALPITRWHFTNDVSAPHLGPVAQDFHAAFGLNGADDKHIATVDAEGVALAAIQGLNQKLADELKHRDAEIAELKQRLEALEKVILNQKPN